MGPWTISQLLSSDVMTWAVGQAQAEGGAVPAIIYIECLGERLGISKKQLFRILGGELSPPVDVLVRLCRATGATRSVEALVEECGLVVVGGLMPADSRRPRPVPVDAAGSDREGSARGIH